MAAPPTPPVPETLPQPLAVLRCRGEGAGAGGPETTYYILGTAHVSAESCEDVTTLIRAVKPQVVLIELCSERRPVLSLDKIREPSLGEVVTEIRTGRATPFQAVYSWLLAKVGRHLDVLPGEEFRVALREAHAIGAQVVLGDRLLTVTLARVWHALGIWEKVKLTGTLLWTGLSMLDTEEMRSEIEKMKETDVLTEAIREFGKEFPSLLHPLITERDQFMAFMLRKLAARAQTVVAIVGAGHLQGIRDHWEKDIDIAEITAMPAERLPLLRWRRVALLTAGGVLVSTALLRYTGRR
ncbi:traB domain-containing -like [Micractinium conductrix]|uniref:TraB domain-containing -like n=1 Tax=Micractinium conductrix TaxID=554055 RepID=A0A2P6VLC0_9CHLO|nr:traB domain-containing -like [Micractinium conductrix]|eukprot:PSC74860.1 traB domain-containing -like [Micractinium conductrix]